MDEDMETQTPKVICPVSVQLGVQRVQRVALLYERDTPGSWVRGIRDLSIQEPWIHGVS